MFAALPMYDRAETRDAHDALWSLVRDGLRARGIAAPEALDREVDHREGWGRPDLVLGQICNLPWRAQFRDRVTVVGTSDYGLPDTPPGLYRSVIVVRADDLRPAGALGPRMAINDPLSCSGWDAPQGWARAEGQAIGSVLVTGAHRASARAVVEGRADWAGIDAITWAGIERWDRLPLRVIGRTDATPGMTFITAHGADPAPIREALEEGIAALPGEARSILGLRGVVTLPAEAYERPLPPEPILHAA